MRDPTRPNQMKFVEFIVFVCRICHEHYCKTDKKKELLFLKIDHLMPKLLEPNKLVPIFSFNERFVVDIQNEVRRLKKRRKKLKNSHANAMKSGLKIEPSLEREIIDIEAQLRKTGMSGITNLGSNHDDAMLEEDTSDSSDDLTKKESAMGGDGQFDRAVEEEGEGEGEESPEMSPMMSQAQS